MEENQPIHKLINNGYEFKLSQYIAEGWNLFKKELSILIGFFLLSVTAVIIGSLVPIIGRYLGQVLSLTFYVGYFVVFNKIKKEETISHYYFFDGFKSIGQLAVIQLILTCFMILLLQPLIILILTKAVSNFEFDSFSISQLKSIGDSQNQFDVIIVVSVATITAIAYIIMQTLYSFAAANAHFLKLPAWKAMELSRKLISKRLGGFLMLTMVVVLINLLGVLLLLVGLLFTIPLSYAFFYAAYVDILKQNGIHLIDEGQEN